MSFRPKNTTVWAEIPVTDLEKSMTFYSAVTGCELTLDETGPNPMAIFQPEDMSAGVAGHLYPGKPAADGSGPTVHLATDASLEEAMTRVKDAGGVVLSPAISIPSGRFFYGQDLDGNSFGLFEFA